MLKLEVLKRDTSEDLKGMREAGIIPAVFYGPKEEATSIKVESAVFSKIFKEAGESTVITLSVDGVEHDVLIHAVDRHPVTEDIQHIDFYVVEKGKKVKVNVPIAFEGESAGEKGGNILVRVIHELEVEAMPKDLPHELKVSLESLNEVGDQVLVKDIKLSEGVETTADGEEPVVLLQEAKEEEVDEPVESPDMDAIEVEGEKAEGESEDGGEEKKEG